MSVAVASRTVKGNLMYHDYVFLVEVKSFRKQLVWPIVVVGDFQLGLVIYSFGTFGCRDIFRLIRA